LRAGTQLGVDFSDGIDVPAQSEEGETGEKCRETGARQEPTVGFQRLGR